MHLLFMPYGERKCVEVTLRDMESQKFELLLYKEKEIMKGKMISGAIRELPFGIKEYIFPKEHLDKVLTTLLKGKENRYPIIGKARMMMMRKIFKAKKIPEFNKEVHYLWTLEHVNFIVIGIREDLINVTEKYEQYQGWSHEAL